MFRLIAWVAFSPKLSSELVRPACQKKLEQSAVFNFSHGKNPFFTYLYTHVGPIPSKEIKNVFILK
jgi:hypothetical protein